MADKELIEALNRNAAAMDRAAQAQFLNFMAIQKYMENRTPTSVKFGSMYLPSELVWKQIVPRNDRRQKIILNCPYNDSDQFWVAISTTDTQDAASVLSSLSTPNSTGQFLTLFVPAGYGSGKIELETTSALYVTSFYFSETYASTINGFISWAETIYSDVSAIPLEMSEGRVNTPGAVEKLTAGLMPVVGDVRGKFSREGVR